MIQKHGITGLCNVDLDTVMIRGILQTAKEGCKGSKFVRQLWAYLLITWVPPKRKISLSLVITMSKAPVLSRYAISASASAGAYEAMRNKIKMWILNKSHIMRVESKILNDFLEVLGKVMLGGTDSSIPLLGWALCTIEHKNNDHWKIGKASNMIEQQTKLRILAQWGPCCSLPSYTFYCPLHFVHPCAILQELV